MLVATEIMEPAIQLPLYEDRIPPGKLMPWNPSAAYYTRGVAGKRATPIARLVFPDIMIENPE